MYIGRPVGEAFSGRRNPRTEVFFGVYSASLTGMMNQNRKQGPTTLVVSNALGAQAGMTPHKTMK